MDPSGSNHSISYTPQSNHLFAVYSRGSTGLMSEGDLRMTGLIDHQGTLWFISVLSRVCQYPLSGKDSRLAHNILDGVAHTFCTEIQEY